MASVWRYWQEGNLFQTQPGFLAVAQSRHWENNVTTLACSCGRPSWPRPVSRSWHCLGRLPARLSSLVGPIRRCWPRFDQIRCKRGGSLVLGAKRLWCGNVARFTLPTAGAVFLLENLDTRREAFEKHLCQPRSGVAPAQVNSFLDEMRKMQIPDLQSLGYPLSLTSLSAFRS